MALLIETIKYRIVTSLFGRRFGLGRSPNGQTYEFLAGPVGIQGAIEDITTTAATSAVPHGHTQVLTSGSSQLGSYTLQAPIPGIRKTLSLNSSSTGNQIFTLTNAVLFTSSGSSAAAVINLKGQGANIELLALSTGVWQQIGQSSSAQALVTFSTST